MNLAFLAVRNIKRSFSKYMMYFFTLSFSVFTVHSFLALVFNEQVMEKLTYSRRYQSMLVAFGVVIFVFVSFFLISSNVNFIKARKKEIAMYSLFGMTNAKIGRLLFTETLIIGTAALVAGICSGVFCSKLTAMILLNFTLAYFVGDIPFVVAPQAVWFTAVPFALVFMLMGAAGRRVIARVELVELFKGSKLPEANIRGSALHLIVSFALIGTGYYWAAIKEPAKLLLLAVPILLVVIAGTFLLFWGGLPQVFRWLRKNPHRYFSGENMIALSIFTHRIRSIGSVMAAIAVMSAVGVTAIATGYTLYGSMEVSTYDQLSYDLFFYGGRDVRDEVHDVFTKYGVGILGEYTVNRYQVKAVQIDPQQTVERVFRIYSESDYNRLIEVSRKIYQPIEVKPGQGLQAGRDIAAYAEIDEPYNDGRQSKLVLSDLELAVVTRADMANVHFGAYQMLVVSDEDFDHLVQTGTFASVDAFGEPLDEVTVIKYENPLRAHQLNSELNQILDARSSGYVMAYNYYVEAMEVFGLVCFIGSFMSVVFILMTASLLYFKQITAAEEERHLYQILRRIGLDPKAESRVIAKRLLPVFFAPLLVGIVHGIFAMKSADTMVFRHMLDVDNTFMVVMRFSAVMYSIYALVYSAFYLITKRQYTSTVR